MSKKLVVCFDGTWNKPDDGSDGKDTNTNVERLFVSIAGVDARGYSGGDLTAGTLKWYDSGVGTKWFQHIRGGAFGYGLSLNIREGYKFLIDNYDPGDEIYVYGFSRGAYTARSMVGLIRNSGLLDRNRILRVQSGADEKYPDWPRPTLEQFKKMHPDDIPHVMDAYQLYRNHDGSADTDFAVSFREQFAHPDVKIRLLGVWDTVGALGIPFKVFESFNAEHYKFHDQELSAIVENAFHAIAIDEHRENFDVTIWNPQQKVNQVMEQVWFAGAHADVGGGYDVPEHPLADASLAWMQRKSLLGGSGLTFNTLQSVNEERIKKAQPTDSYREFMGGMYRIVKDRYYRKMGVTEFGNEFCSSICGQITGYAPKNQGYITIKLELPAPQQ
ncbi:DUF2235 domain-containing protein [Geomonas paludis]|uniref:DUF2235 domain-containing protein n=1 Tax=Geomonas paludis TaxID=2740185 RepID=A0A6V8MRU1_9BACT|nr:DUF2235 domain-containing protein [Geomonas paludis]UPU35690.1 DUF2235 domain-containing protein [Geomonas paludis]GFO62731.1 hypothetical protein GMPD_06500 [Geomonas paludis]